MISRIRPRLSRSLGRVTAVLAVLTVTLRAFTPAIVRAQDATTPPSEAPLAIGLEPFADGFTRPVLMIDPDDGTGRMFVVEQGGTVRIIQDGKTLDQPFLDISGQVSSGNEQGLLSIALHPDFKNNGLFYIDYTDVNGNTQIEQWSVSSDDPNVADPSSAKTLLSVDQPYPNHNGGLLLFGPDNLLYIGLGDGGSQGDPSGTGQRPDDLLGSILRIDVDTTTGDLPYGIPKDNPFADGKDGRPEVFAYGFRNPWRFSFDRETGDLYIGDVGQNIYEEIDVIPSGSEERNFGWNVMEGFSCYNADTCDEDGLTKPIFAYSHDVGGCSVTGGYIYRGSDIDDLKGVYVFADYCTGLLWGLRQDSGGNWQANEPIETGLSVSSFAEDADGNLYVIDLNGGISKIVAGT